ncbi:MAG: beta-galactosidase [Victivallales bacterium]
MNSTREQITEILRYPVEGNLYRHDVLADDLLLRCMPREVRTVSGMEIPWKTDWKDSQWLAFQRFREDSLADFAKKLTQTVRQIRPDATVTHQFSPVLHGRHRADRRHCGGFRLRFGRLLRRQAPAEAGGQGI